MFNTCKKYENLIYDYIDGTLNEKQSVKVKKHLETCDNCKELQQLFIMLKENFNEIILESVPSDFNSQLHLKLVNEAQKSTTHQHKFIPYVNVAVTVALLALVIFNANTYNKPITETYGTKNITVNEEKTEVPDAKPKAENKTEPKKSSSIDNHKQEDVADNATPPMENTKPEVTTDVAIPQTENTQQSVMTDEANLKMGDVYSITSIVSYGLYSIDLSGNDELFDKILNEFDVTAEGETYTVFCDDEQFIRFNEILENTGVELVFESDRETSNIIKIKK